MRSTKQDNIKLGLFITIAFLLLSSALYIIGSKQNLFGSTFALRSVFKNVNGLSPGNSVRFSGINVGTVKDIIILNDTTIEVTMSMQKKVQPYVKQDAIARIGSDGLVGNMLINIAPGKGERAEVGDNDVIKSYANHETEDIMNTLGATTDNIAILVFNLLELTEQINDGKGSLNMLIKNEQLATDLQLSAHHLKQSSQNINKISQRLRLDFESSMNSGQGVLSYLLNDTTFKNQVAHITEGLDTLIRQRTDPVLNNMEKASEEIAGASSQINDLIHQIDLNKGLLHKLLRDSIAEADMERALHNLDEGLLRFNETMEALQHNILVRKYFKRQKKAKSQKENK
jgi:phospholipid/cholesterol/gamma-HCH transport system substrate-binding protein